jgi:protein import protein ZIM17
MQIFSDKSITLEDILAEKGQLLKKGALDSESDMEFWDDGTQTERTKKP